MKIEKEVYETTLSNEAIDECSNKIREFLTKLKLSNKQITRYSFSAEEIMLNLLDKNTSKKLKLTMGKKLFSPYFSIEIDGEQKNVYVTNEDEHSFLGDSILSNLNLSPDYVYAKNKNEYSFRLKRKSLHPLLTMLIAFLSAIIIGSLGFLFGENFRTTLTDNLIEPIYETFLRVLGSLAGPMIFLSVAWGIYGMGDVSTLKRIGKNIFLGYIMTLFIGLIIVALVCLPFFNWNYTTSSSGGNAFSQIFQMFLNIFPNNIVEPFSSGNTLQIIFIAFIIGIALIFLGKKTTSVARAIEQINYIIQFITEFISKLVPFFTFNTLLIMIWTSEVDSFLSMWKLFSLLIGSILLVTTILIGFNALRQKTSFFTLVKKGLPTLISAITTASSAASFGMNIKSSTEDFGIDKSLVAFSIPLGMVLFKATTAISYILLAYFYAEFFAINVTIDWFVLVIIISGVLAMATPPIPGGATISYTILLTQFLSAGTPEIINTALAMTITIDVFLDFITTGFDMFLLPFALINPASRIDLLDKKVLRSKKTIKEKEKAQ